MTNPSRSRRAIATLFCAPFLSLSLWAQEGAAQEFNASPENGPIQDVHVVMDTQIRDIDGSHWTVEFGKTRLENLRENLIEKTARQQDILVTANESVLLHVFVPASMSADDRQDFTERIIKEMKLNGSRVEVRLVDVDVEAMTQNLEKDVRVIEASSELTVEGREKLSAFKTAMHQKILTMKAWSSDFLSFTKTMRKFNKWPLEQKFMFFGSIIGLGKSVSSVAFWTKETGVNALGIAQSMMALTLDVVFSRWGHIIENWKASHRIPSIDLGIANRVIEPIRRLYNEQIVIKAFIVNNLIGISAGAYFRWLSWWADSSGKIQPPWSMEYAYNIIGGMSLGGVTGAAGSQGVRTLRKKGYISVGVEYSIYQLFGMGMQIGGFLNGSGMTELFWLYLKTEAASKAILYGASKVLPTRDRRLIVFHPTVSDSQIKDLKYRLGVYDAVSSEAKTFESDLVERSNPLGWFEKLDQKWKLLERSSRLLGQIGIQFGPALCGRVHSRLIFE